MPAREVDSMLGPLPVMIVDVDVNLTRVAGRLRATTAEAGLSLGDRFCIALASRDGLPAWTADEHWQTISAAVGVKVVVIR